MCPSSQRSVPRYGAYSDLYLLQVSNQVDAIKIACDFLSAESLQASKSLVQEHRKQRLVNSWPDDVLQFDTTLWHAWGSLQRLRDEAVLGSTVQILE